MSDKDHRVFYDDITHQKGLTEEQYLHIINQLCFHFDLIYKYCKHYIESSKEYEEESNEYFEKATSRRIRAIEIFSTYQKPSGLTPEGFHAAHIKL